MQAFYAKHRDRINRFAFFAGFLLFVFVFFNYLFDYIAPFFFGMIIALVLSPLVRLLEERVRLKRWLATVICLLLFMAAIGFIGTWLVSTLITQAGEFIKAAPEMIDEISIQLAEWQSRLPLAVRAIEIEGVLLDGLTGIFGDGLMSQSRRIVSNAPQFLVSVILTLISAFFMTKDRKMIVEKISERCPEWLRENFRTMREGLSRAVGGYVKAQLILMSITCIISIAGLLIMRSPYALILGLLMAFLDFLPFFGTGAILLPWAAFSLLSAEYMQAIGLVILYGVIFVTRQILEPKVLSEQIGVYPLVTLMAIFVGYRVFGFIGIILGPALVMIFIAMGKKREKTSASVTTGT